MHILTSIQQVLLSKLVKQVVVIEAIEIRGALGNELYFNVVSLVRKKKEIKIQNSIDYIPVSRIKDLYGQFYGDVPVILIINSDKIIHKSVSGNSVSNSYLKELLPNVDPDNFYTQLFPVNSSQSYLSVIRKNFTDQVLDLLSFMNNSIIKVMIGPFFILYTYSYLYTGDEENVYDIQLENYSFLIQNDIVLDYKISPYSRELKQEFIAVREEKLSSRFVLAYSCGINYLLQPATDLSLVIEHIENNNAEYNYRKLSKLILFSAVGIVFAVLLVSTFFFNSYHEKYEKLESQYSQKSDWWDKYQLSKKQEQNRLDILRTYGLYDSSNVSFYADQLTIVLPEDLYLKKMEVHPVNTRAFTENVDFIQSKIFVEGNCYSSNGLSEWINDVKTYKWVKNIIIKEYKQNKDGLSTFIVEITKDNV